MNLNWQMVLILSQIFKILLKMSGIAKKYETLTAIPIIHVYIKRINRLVFKIKDEHKLALQTYETMKKLAAQKN